MQADPQSYATLENELLKNRNDELKCRKLLDDYNQLAAELYANRNLEIEVLNVADSSNV